MRTCFAMRRDIDRIEMKASIPVRGSVRPSDLSVASRSGIATIPTGPVAPVRVPAVTTLPPVSPIGSRVLALRASAVPTSSTRPTFAAGSASAYATFPCGTAVATLASRGCIPTTAAILSIATGTNSAKFGIAPFPALSTIAAVARVVARRIPSLAAVPASIHSVAACSTIPTVSGKQGPTCDRIRVPTLAAHSTDATFWAAVTTRPAVTGHRQGVLRQYARTCTTLSASTAPLFVVSITAPTSAGHSTIFIVPRLPVETIIVILGAVRSEGIARWVRLGQGSLRGDAKHHK